MVQSFTKRATSPLHFEPLSPLPEDILYPGSEEEDALEGHRDKRRRVEALGQQYLQGRPLFILSAGLRGPLHDGWVNPWASKKEWRRDDIRRIPQECRRGNVEAHEGQIATELQPKRSDDGNHVAAQAKSSDTVDTGLQPRSKSSEYHEEELPGRSYPTIVDRVSAEMPRPQGGIVVAPSNARNASENIGLAQETPDSDLPKTVSKEWLKSDNALLKSRSKNRSKSPTPTPKTGNWEHRRMLLNSTPSAQEARPLAPKSPQVYDQAWSEAAHGFGFTPINRPTISPNKRSPSAKRKVRSINSLNVRANMRNLLYNPTSVVHERAITGADKVAQEGYQNVNRLLPGAIDKAVDSDSYLKAEELSQEAAVRAYNVSSDADSAETSNGSVKAVFDQVPFVRGRPKILPNAVKGSPHAVSPSTNLPGFQYRFASKASSASSSLPSSRDASPFVEHLGAAKATSRTNGLSKSSRNGSPNVEKFVAAKKEVKVKATKRLSFSDSGGIRTYDSRKISRNHAGPPTSRSKHTSPERVESNLKDPSNEKIRVAEMISPHASFTNHENPSHLSEVLAEAQFVPAPNAPYPFPSGPSTNLLETDKQSLKFPSVEEGDSYANLSTQAAIIKAQLSFQNDALSPFKESARKLKASIERSPLAYKTPLLAGPPLANTMDQKDLALQQEEEEEPLSTQAMINAMSPFAVTTVKKNPTTYKRASFAPFRHAVSPTSPTPRDIDTQKSLSMSTTPSPSSTHHTAPTPSLLPPSLPHSHSRSLALTLKPTTSNLTSFSIAPNGTLTEVGYQQDGQQVQFPDYYSGGTACMADSNWGLEAALEEAGTFLGGWNVEVEARKEGSSGGTRNGKGESGVLAGGKEGG